MVRLQLSLRRYTAHSSVNTRQSVRAFLVVILTVAWGCDRREASLPSQFRVSRETTHDPTAYTQGLVLDDSVFYESTGLYGHSEIRKVDTASGRILQRSRLPETRFGEGLALLGDRLYQLTWESGIAYIYDKTSLTIIDSVAYPGEGWGLTTDGAALIMSDGSDSLRIMTPNFKVTRAIHVRYQDSPMHQLNELEFLGGDVLANVYQSDWVVRIDLKTGNVKDLLDFAELYLEKPGSAEVMNGIAASPRGELFLTGKYWPKMYKVTLESPRAPSNTR